MASRKSYCLISCILVILLQPARATKLTKCQTAKALYQNGIPKADIPNWLCLIQHESNYNTAAINHNTNGSTDYGIFQINSQYWCGISAPGKSCNVKCSSLLDANISDDIKCAKKIKSSQGWNAWYGWKNHCRGVTLPSIKDCKL